MKFRNCVCANEAGVPEHGAKNLGFITSSASANAMALFFVPVHGILGFHGPVFQGNKQLAPTSTVDTDTSEQV